MKRRLVRSVLCSLVAFPLLCPSSRAADVVSTFSAIGPASWTTASWFNNPALGGFPNDGNLGVATYDAVVNTNFTLTLDQDITVQKFTMNGGILAGSFNFTANDLLHSASATFSGSGVTKADGGIQIDGYANYTDGHTFNVAGSSTFTGSVDSQAGYFYVSNGAMINNSGTFDVGWSANFNNNIVPNVTSGTIDNTGTFTRSVGSGTTNVAVVFNNSSIVSVQAGTLTLTGGGTESGSFQVGMGAALRLGNQPMTVATGTSFSGLGTTTISNITTVTGTVTTSDESTLVITNTVKGTGTLTAAGLLHLASGTMSEAGITNANGTLQIDDYQNFLDARTLNINGAATFTGSTSSQAGYFYVSNGATINNAGSFDVGWAANFNNNIVPNGPAGSINNTGTFTRSGGNGTTTVSIPLANSQIVTMQSGTLLLNGGGKQSGSFQVGMGATLGFGGINNTFAAGTTLAGPGTTIISGTVNVTGPAVTYSGGGLLKVTGTLTGAGTLTATAPIELASGTMSGGGVTNANGGIQIDGYQNFVDTRTLNINSSATFTGDAPSQGGYFFVSNGATVNNGGTFDSGWAANFNNNIVPNGPAGLFNNTGTFTRSVGSGTTTVSVPFKNSHIVSVQAGTLLFSGGGTQSGSFQVATGAQLTFNGNNNTFADGATFSGPGTTILNGTATVTAPLVTYSGGGVFQVTGTLNGDGTFTAMAPLQLSGGTMSDNGITNANGGLAIDGYQSFLETRTLNIGAAASASLTGNAPSQGGFFYVYIGGTVNNSGTFDTGWAANFNNSIGQNGPGGTFNNLGTFTRSVGSGATTVSIPFNNSNLVTVQAGTLVLSGGGTHSGSFQVGNSAVLRFDGNSTVLAAGSSLSGPGTILVPGTVTVTGPAVTFSGGGSLQLTGTLTGAGTLTATAPIEWSGGLMSAAGTTTANGGLQIDGYQNSLDTRTLNIGGAAIFTGSAPSGAGYLYIANGATINNSSTFDVGWSANLNNTIVNNGAAGPVNNSGTLTRSVGSGTTTVQVPFVNTGSVDVRAGKLEFDNRFSLGDNSSLRVSAGRLLFNVNVGTPSVGSGVTATVSDSGTLELAGSVSVLGAPSPAADRVAISNSSSAAAGLLVSAGNHQVGAISGTGTTQVDAGTSLRADSIIQDALLIGGAPGSRGTVTISPSDDSGQPLSAESASGSSGGSGNPADVGSLAVSNGAFANPALSAASPGALALDGNSVPEPTAISLALAGLVGLSSLSVRHRRIRRRN